MTKVKKITKKANPEGEEKPEQVIKKIDEENPKKKKQQLKKIKKAVKAGLVEPPAPVLAKDGELNVKTKSGKKSKAKKKALKKSSDAVEKVEGKKEVEANTKVGAKPKAKKDVVDGTPDLAKQAKREKNKLKKKLRKASEKENKSESVAGPGQTIFVGNVPSNTKRIQLTKLFSACGKIMSIRFRTANGKVIFKHKMRKESAGLNAYVVFDSSEAATKALELNGTALKDQILRVQKPESAQEASDPKNTVLVGNLKYSATDDKLHQIFSSCGAIEYVRTLQSADKKGCIGTAFVCFKEPDAVGLALELKGTMLDERPIHVERYNIKKLGANNKRIAENKTLVKGKKKGGKPLAKAALELRNNTKHPGQKHIGKKIQDNKSQDQKKKKSEFRGVKSEKMKKKLKKKIPTALKRLANKIAPKE